MKKWFLPKSVRTMMTSNQLPEVKSFLCRLQEEETKNVVQLALSELGVLMTAP